VKIVAADVIVTSPDRNFVTLKITTDEGITGLGDGTLNGRELSVASYLRDHVVPLLIGRDPHRIEDTWQFLYRSAYWRRGPVTMAAIAAVDVALWDIKAKAANMPLYQLLGGASRSATTWNSATGRSGSRPRCRESTRSTASPPSRAWTASGTTTSRRSARRSPSRRTGTPGRTCGTCPGSSRRSATSSAPSCRCCTTHTTG